MLLKQELYWPLKTRVLAVCLVNKISFFNLSIKTGREDHFSIG